MGRLAFTVLLLILGYQITYAQHFEEKSKFTGFSIGYTNYRSFSQQKPSMKMRSGYPVIIGKMPVFSVQYIFSDEKKRHRMEWNIAKPFGLSSDNGTGRNILLTENESTYFRSSLNYHLTWSLFTRHWLKLRHGFNSGLLFESRNMEYQAGSSEKTSDINLCLGPVLQVKVPVNNAFSFFGEYDGRFHLPWLNYGKIKMYGEDENPVYESNYSGFFYQAVFRAGVSYKLEDSKVISLMAEKNDIAGYAGPNRSFSAEGMNHFKLDRLLGIYLRVEF
ncbi:MAG: hypothetical protein ACQETJ_08810 [Bacteroidota bacterium]